MSDVLDYDYDAPPVDAPTREREALPQGLEALATATVVAPVLFALAYAIAWFFSIKNFLLISGHVGVLIASALLIETGHRLRRHGVAKGPGVAAEVLGLLAAVMLLYALLPMSRMFLAVEEPVFAAIESADPQARLAMVTFGAYTLLGAGLAAVILGVAKLGQALSTPTRGINQALFATLAAAGLASGLHAAFGFAASLRDLRHVLALALTFAGVWAIAKLRPALYSVAHALRRAPS